MMIVIMEDNIFPVEVKLVNIQLLRCSLACKCLTGRDIFRNSAFFIQDRTWESN